MRQVLPIAGAIVGAYFGNPQLGFAIGSLIGNAVDPQEIQGSKVGDNPMQTASEGGARAIVFGTGCVRATCLLERGNRQIVEVEDQAGKGGPVTVSERVYWTFAIGLGEAIPGGAIIRIWEGEKLVYDASPDSAIPAETAEFARKFRFYDGSEDQLPDPALEAINGIGNAHYYRGTAYVVFPNFDLTDYREQIPVFRWEVSRVAEVQQPVQAVAVRTHNNQMSWAVSNDGTTLSSWQLTGPGISPLRLVANDERYIGARPGVGTIGYLDDLTAGWQTATGDGIGGNVGLPWADGNEVAIAGVVSGIAYSSNGGTHFDRDDSGPKIDAILKIGGTWVGINGSSSYTGSSPIALAQNSGVLSGIGLTIYIGQHAKDELGIYVGSRLGDGPAAVSTSNGIVFTDEAVPAFSSATKINCITHGFVGETPFWVVGTDSGEIARRDALGNWTIVANFGASVLDVTYNGDVFLMIGGRTTDGDSTGYLKSSSDLVNWITISSDALVGANAAWNQVKALHVGAFVADPAKVTVASIVSDLHQRAGHSAGQFDVSELTDLTAGIVFEQSITYGEAINTLIGPYMADPSEYDKAIHYLKRGKPVVRTLTEDDLVDEPETSRRENAIEYPRKLHYFFQSPITHYAATKATSARSSPDVHVIGEVSISSPITYDNPDEPAQVSAKLHKIYWADAEGEIVWHVTDEHADLVPGDCVGLNLRGVVRRARITSIEDDPGVRKLTMRIDRQSAYTSNVTGIPLPPPTPPRPSIIAPSVGLTMDIPALTDDADDLHYLRAIFGITDVWAGAVDQRSLDSGASFASINTASRAAIVGTLQADVAAASPHCTDTTNQVVVNLYVDRDLESISQQQFLSEGGAFALSYMDGGVRKWELCQYRDAEQDSDGNWILSTLHRGLLNTTAAAHSSGDYFVLLDRALLKNNAQAAWLGQELVHRAVSNGLSPETASTETTTYTGQSQTEWPVASVGLDLDGDDLAVSIVPRHRFGTDDAPIRSINWTGYRVLATDGANSESYDTTSDTSVIDVTGWTGTITVTVSQINRITGAGPTVTESIPA